MWFLLNFVNNFFFENYTLIFSIKNSIFALDCLINTLWVEKKN